MKNGLLTLALLAGISTAAVAQQAVNIVENQNYIEVTGYNRDEVAPDEIYFSFQINENDTKGRVSITDQEKQMVAALRNIGINIEEQLTVKDMSSNFKKYVLRRTDIQLSREYQLKVSDAQTAASVFAALESVGIAGGTITKAEYSKMDEFLMDSKAFAMKNAQEKAAKLAGAIGQTIGKAIFIQDFDRGHRPVVLYSRAATADMAMPESALAPGIEFEKITVESNVTVRFLLD